MQHSDNARASLGKTLIMCFEEEFLIVPLKQMLWQPHGKKGTPDLSQTAFLTVKIPSLLIHACVFTSFCISSGIYIYDVFICIYIDLLQKR